MTDPRDRDDAMDRLVRQTLRASVSDPAGASPSCLDAETIAAWMDGGLQAPALAAAEAHASSCARCGAIVAAMVRAEEPATPEPAADRRWWPWLLPLAAAAVVIIAVALPRRSQETQQSQQARVEESAADAALPAPPAAAPTEAPKLNAELKKEAAPAAELAARKPAAPQAARSAAPQTRMSAAQPQAKAATAADRVTASPAARTAAPATQALGAAMESVAGRIGPFEINTPNLAIRWRVTGSAVARTIDSGATWQPVPTGPATADFTAGAAPSADVCWLIGRGGIVALTIDGRTWRRLVFPELTDLSAIVATDARTATITAVDGRAWVTSDAGITWVRRPVQGISPAPFYE